MNYSKIRDKNNRLVAHGDLIRVYHFTTARRRKVYMHFLISFEKGHFFCISLLDILRSGITKATRCQLKGFAKSETVEILNGFADTDGLDLICWWERPRR